MDVYVYCRECKCYVDEKESSVHIGYYDGYDYNICFECQPQ